MVLYNKPVLIKCFFLEYSHIHTYSCHKHTHRHLDYSTIFVFLPSHKHQSSLRYLFCVSLGRAIMIPFSPCQRWWWTFLQIDVFSSQGKMISQAKRHVRSIANFHLWGGMVEWLLVVHNREFPVTPCYQITAQGSHNYWLYTNWDISHYWNKAKDNTRVVVK